MLEKVADSARRAVKLAEPYKPYGGQFIEFCSISLSTYQTCMKLTRKCTEFCPHYGIRFHVIGLVARVYLRIQIKIYIHTYIPNKCNFKYMALYCTVLLDEIRSSELASSGAV